MSEERQLTEEDREKIVRLLESGTLENVTLALSLIEETAGQEDIADIFTMNVIVELICLNDPESLEAMVRAAHVILKYRKTWSVFSEAVVDVRLLTSQRCQPLLESSSISDVFSHELRFATAISSAAAEHLMGQLDSGWTPDHLNLSSLRFLSDVVAQTLSRFRGELRLDSLTELSDAAAESLSQHEGTLTLQWLQRLSEAATESLSKHRGLLETNANINARIKQHVSSERKKARKSSLTGQRVLTKQQTTKIRKLLRGKSSDQAQTAVQLMEAAGATVDDVTDVFSTSIISLLVNTWDVDVWNALAPLLLEHQVQRQEFSDLVRQRFFNKSMGSQASVAASLFKRAAIPLDPLIKDCGILGQLPTEGSVLAQYHLTELSDAGAKLFVMSGDTLFSLEGLTTLSDAAAESLSKHEGEIDLCGLTNLSDAAAESLSKHEGQPTRGWTMDLGLGGLTELSAAAAESLSKHKGHLDLGGLTELSDAAAESLSKHKDLDLSGLTELSAAAAESLSKYEGELSLYDLTELSDAAAESLSKHTGETLKLRSLTELSDTAARSLSNHEGELWLDGITKLSDAAAKCISKHSSLIIHLDNLPASAAQILREAGHGE